MYSESDLQAAVEAGAISQAAADALRNHAADRRASPLVDEEHFRLLTGFNDIFVAIASVILLVAVGWLGQDISGGVRSGQPAVLAGILVTLTSWGLAEYFTRVRRMALPSILLLLSFMGGCAFTLFAAAFRLFPDAGPQIGAVIASGIALATAGAAWMHWRRFMVPITVAAGAAAIGGLAVTLTLSAIPDIGDTIFYIVMAAGVAIFAVAM